MRMYSPTIVLRLSPATQSTRGTAVTHSQIRKVQSSQSSTLTRTCEVWTRTQLLLVDGFAPRYDNDVRSLVARAAIGARGVYVAAARDWHALGPTRSRHQLRAQRRTPLARLAVRLRVRGRHVTARDQADPKHGRAARVDHSRRCADHTVSPSPSRCALSSQASPASCVQHSKSPSRTTGWPTVGRSGSAR